MSKDEGTTTVEDYLPSEEDFDYETFEPTMSDTIGKLAGALAKAQSTMTMVQGNRWDTSNNGFYITSMLMHSSGEWIKSEIRMPIAKKDAHGIGAATTYGRRYLLSSMVGVAQADDDGNGAIQRAPRPSDQVNKKR